jgi:hypothetical protein
MKKNIWALMLLLTAGTFLVGQQIQSTPGEKNVATVLVSEEQITATQVDYLSGSQIDAFWYLADTAKSLSGVIYSISKSGVYMTAIVPSTDDKLKVLACIDWHTGRIERYQILDSSNNVLYTFQRQADDTFMSTEKTGYVEIPLKIGKQEGLITFCRVTVISAATAMLSS